MAKTTANKLEQIPEYTETEEGYFLFADGVKVRVSDVKFATNCINSDLRETLEESLGESYEKTILARKYRSAVKAREEETQKLKAEKELKEERLIRAKEFVQDLAEQKRLFFHDRFTGETSTEIPQDLTDGSIALIKSTYNSIHFEHSAELITLQTNESIKKDVPTTAFYCMVCK